MAFDRERETTLTRTNVAPSNCSQAWIGVAGCRPVRVEEEEEEEDDDNDDDDDDADYSCFKEINFKIKL